MAGTGRSTRCSTAATTTARRIFDAHPRPSQPVEHGARRRAIAALGAAHHLGLAQRPQRARARPHRRPARRRAGRSGPGSSRWPTSCSSTSSSPTSGAAPIPTASAATPGVASRDRRSCACGSLAYVGGLVLLFASDQPRGRRRHRRLGHRTPARDRRSGRRRGHACSSIFVVRDITARQEALQARDPAPPERPIARQYAAPTTVDGPGLVRRPGPSLRPPLLGRHRVDRAREPRRRGVAPRR